MEKRVSTGIKKLDGITEGGFKQGSMNLIVGGPGTGKSIFGTQFLVDGIKNAKENGAYISFEQTREKYLEDMTRFGWDLEKLEKEKKLAIIPMDPFEFKKEVYKEAWDFVLDKAKAVKAKRIVVDSVTAYAFLYDKDKEKREAMLKLFDYMSTWGYTVVMLSQDKVGIEDTELRDPIQDHLSDSIISFYVIRKGDMRSRAIEIRKMRGTKHMMKIIPMDITDKGMNILPDGSVFGVE